MLNLQQNRTDPFKVFLVVSVLLFICFSGVAVTSNYFASAPKEDPQDIAQHVDVNIRGAKPFHIEVYDQAESTDSDDTLVPVVLTPRPKPSPPPVEPSPTGIVAPLKPSPKGNVIEKLPNSVCHRAGHNGASQCFADFMFMGVSKCGTSSFGLYLHSHPQLRGFREKGEGEDNFFDQKWYKPEMYWDYAPMLPPGNNEYIFHYDSQYSSKDEVLPRIMNLFPNQGRSLKYLMLLRDPVSRTHSSFAHRTRKKVLPPNLPTDYNGAVVQQLQVVKSRPDCFESSADLSEACKMVQYDSFDVVKSLYHMQIRRYLYLGLPMKQLKVITLEQFIADKVGVYESVINWFGFPLLGKNGEGFESMKEVEDVLADSRNQRVSEPADAASVALLQRFFLPYNELLYAQLRVSEPLWPYYDDDI